MTQQPNLPSTAVAEDELDSNNPFEVALQSSPAQTPPPPPDIIPEEPSRPRRRWIKVFLTLFFLTLVAGGIGGGLWYKQEMERRWKWESIPMPDVMAKVPEPWTVAKLAERMQATKKINDAATFEEAAAQVGLTSIQEGHYELPAKANPLDLAKVFKAGPTHFNVTFPEGFTSGQFAARLSSRGFTGGAELLRLAYPPNKVSPLEGRLFPNTYLLPQKATGKELAGRFQEEFLKVTDALPRPFPKVAGKSLTLSQLVILASIIEREAASAQEMPQVAGVLINRLRKPMRLQVDASIQYARVRAVMEGRTKSGHKERLLFKDLAIRSPYNTYQNDGLPPGPICNPGEAALRAAARPASSNYLFYVMSPALKRHRFARTFAEHQRNIRLAIRERRALEAAKKS